MARSRRSGRSAYRQRGTARHQRNAALSTAVERRGTATTRTAAVVLGRDEQYCIEKSQRVSDDTTTADGETDCISSRISEQLNSSCCGLAWRRRSVRQAVLGGECDDGEVACVEVMAEHALRSCCGVWCCCVLCWLTIDEEHVVEMMKGRRWKEACVQSLMRTQATTHGRASRARRRNNDTRTA